jgi:hypothetical protein
MYDVVCEVCKGKGQVHEDGTPIVTNFERISASPEALAEFIYCLVESCDYYAGNGARKISQYATEDTEDKFHIELIHGNRDFGELLEWLNEESKE